MDERFAEFNSLVDLIQEELDAQLAMGRLGTVDPPANGSRDVASLIADILVRVYDIRRRVDPPSQPAGTGSS